VRLERLVTDLLELARLGADEFRLDVASVDLGALVRDCAEVWQLRCAREDVRLSVSAPAGPVPVLADARRLRQVVGGLAEDAPEGGAAFTITFLLAASDHTVPLPCP